MPATIRLALTLNCDSTKCKNPGSPTEEEFDSLDADGHPTRNKLRRAAINAGWSVKQGRWFCKLCTGRMRAAKVVPGK